MRPREISFKDYLSEMQIGEPESWAKRRNLHQTRKHFQVRASLSGAFKPRIYLLTTFYFLANPLFPTYLLTRDTVPKDFKKRESDSPAAGLKKSIAGNGSPGGGL